MPIFGIEGSYTNFTCEWHNIKNTALLVGVEFRCMYVYPWLRESEHPDLLSTLINIKFIILIAI